MAVSKSKEKSVGAKKVSGPVKNPFARAAQYLKEVRGEFRKVIWPDRQEITSSTIVVVVTLAFFIALIAAMDLVFSQIVQTLLPIIGG